MKKKAGKSKASRSMKSLPAKSLNGRSAKAIKGGGTAIKGKSTPKSDLPTENITLNYGKVEYEY